MHFVKAPSGSLECLIGWFTMALGAAIWTPNMSVPYYVLNEFGSSRSWSMGLTAIGLALIVIHKFGSRPYKVAVSGAAFFMWLSITGLIGSVGPLGPTGFNGVVICVYLAYMIWGYIAAPVIPPAQ